MHPTPGPEIITPYDPPSNYPRHAKLKPSEVLEIRDLLSKGVFDVHDLALQYDVTTSAIHHIKRRVTWKYLSAAPTNP